MALQLKSDDYIELLKNCKIRGIKTLPNNVGKTIQPTIFIDILKGVDDKKVVEHIINSLENQNLKKFFGIIKYYICDSYMFEKDLLEIDHNKELHKALDIIDNNPDTFLTFISYPFLYEISYLNFNKKDLLSKSYKIISKYLKNSFKKREFNKKKRKRIKIAFYGVRFQFPLSSVFRDRSEIIKRMDRTKFEKYLIFNGPVDLDSYNSSYRGMFKSLIDSVDYVINLNVPNKDTINLQSYQELQNLDIDVMVFPDIGMTSHGLLGLFRLAPVQINTWGHSVTSGFDTIDYYFSSKLYEIEDAQKHYSEKLVRMNNLCTCYIEYKYTNFETREQLGLPTDKKIIFCAQMVKKLNWNFLKIIKQILDKVPNTVVMLTTHCLTDNIQEKIKKLLDDRVIYIPMLMLKEFNNHMYLCDIVLDTYPFGGCNGSLEAFAKGKIVITMPSEYLSGRFTYGFYCKMGIKDVIVDNYNDYVEKAVLYLTNDEKRKELEQRILSKKHLLFNDNKSIKEWEDKIIEITKPYVDLDQTITESGFNLLQNRNVNYYTLKSDRLRLIIFWNAKCACTSLKRFIYEIEEQTTYKGNNIHGEIGYLNRNKYFVNINTLDNKYKQYRKVLVYRDPLERVESFYKDKIKNINTPQADRSLDNKLMINIGNNTGLDVLVNLMELIKPDKLQHHLHPQTLFLEKEWIDEIISIDELDSFFKRYTNNMYRENKTKKKKKSKSTDLTLKCQRILRNIYQQDYEFFYHFKPTTKSLMAKIKLMTNVCDYRIGDVIYKSGFKHEDSKQKVLTKREYRDTILYKYLQLNNGNDIVNLHLLKHLIPLTKRRKKELVIHIRAGDVVVHDWFLKKNYIKIIEKYQPIIEKVTIVIAYTYGNYIEKNLWIYNDEKQKTNEKKIQILFNCLLSRFPKLKFNVISNEKHDEDFVYCVNSSIFIPDKGGFSDLIYRLHQSDQSNLKCHFITYGDEKYRKCKEQLVSEAYSFGVFESATAYGSGDLTKEFREEFKDTLKKPRGVGYWIWKYDIMKQEFDKMNYGDILVYLDAGCCINIEGKARFNEYLRMLCTGEYGTISFKYNDKWRPEKHWTTKQLFNKLNVKDSEKNIGQLYAGVIILQKCESTISLLDEFYRLLKDDSNLFTDYYNKTDQDSCFKENRHDQSVFSLLRKKYGTIMLSDEAKFLDGTKEAEVFKTKKYPFWALRRYQIDPNFR